MIRQGARAWLLLPLLLAAGGSGPAQPVSPRAGAELSLLEMPVPGS